jgi:hypothetical protein
VTSVYVLSRRGERETGSLLEAPASLASAAGAPPARAATLLVRMEISLGCTIAGRHQGLDERSQLPSLPCAPGGTTTCYF